MVFCKSENRLLKFFPKIYFLIFENAKNHVTLILKFQIYNMLLKISLHENHVTLILKFQIYNMLLKISYMVFM